MSLSKKWEKANKYCSGTYGTALAKIRDVSDAMNIQMSCSFASYFWIGLNDRDDEDVWRWTDDTLWYVC